MSEQTHDSRYMRELESGINQYEYQGCFSLHTGDQLQANCSYMYVSNVSTQHAYPTEGSSTPEVRVLE